MFQHVAVDPLLPSVGRGFPFMKIRPTVPGDIVALPKPRRRGRTRVKLSKSAIREPGFPGFLHWLRRDFPAAHAALAARRPELLRAALAGPGQLHLAQAELPAASTTGQRIADFVMPLLQVYQQRQILKLQLARAKAGQPPLDVESLSAPATRIELEAGARTQRTGLLIAGALGLGAVAWFLTRGRARA